MPMRLALVAGEASGDLLGGLLLAALRQRWPELRAVGIGGPRLAEQGFEAWWPHERLAVRGYVEVLRHYREISGIRDAMAERLLRERPARIAKVGPIFPPAPRIMMSPSSRPARAVGSRRQGGARSSMA